MHPCRSFLPPTERAQDCLSLKLISNGTDTIAAELMPARQTCRRQDDVHANIAKDILIELLLHNFYL
jgi:hypothetical protein